MRHVSEVVTLKNAPRRDIPSGLGNTDPEITIQVYEDLRKSIKYLKEQSWIPLITAEPPALIKDISRGYELSQEEVMPGISYDDLARGMVQMAEEDGGHKWVGKGVGIKATGKVKMDYLPLIVRIFRAHISPFGANLESCDASAVFTLVKCSKPWYTPQIDNTDCEIVIQWYLLTGLVAYFSPAAWKLLQRAGLNP